MLFKSTADLQQFIELNSHVNFASLQSSIRTAEKELLVPIIGLSFYLDLDTKYNAVPTTLNAEESQLVAVIQAALAPYSMVLFIPKSEVNITDGGIIRNETETSKTAYQYQVTNLKKSFQEETDRAVEFLIQYLEFKKNVFPTWTASAEFTKYRGLFIKTGEEMNEYFTMATPWRNYMAMRAVMKTVEDRVIKANLGEDYYAVLKTKEASAATVYSTEEKELLVLIKRVVANLTVAAAIPILNTRIDASGLSIVSAGPSSRDEDSKRRSAESNHVSQLQRTAEQWGGNYLSDLNAYLKAKASATVFPEYFTWQQSLNNIDNSSCSAAGIFGMY